MVSTRRTIPTSFHGAWINVATRSGYFRAVDWADFILFVIPTLVAERVRDQAARKALLDLVQTCNLLMSWELSAEEQTLIKTNLVAWNACLEASLAKRTGNWRVLSSETAPKLEAVFNCFFMLGAVFNCFFKLGAVFNCFFKLGGAVFNCFFKLGLSLIASLSCRPEPA
ncbi:hypothetical protein PHYBLDRAFT_160052 [Phycomyces blakesleeanus NRRL 1555(-)]|uniref:Uncharacterized protein n=1 Tax=Phycomyces blakesleeanus (strain ATCC 8743b / DSM 1359 / FGSC 10004 / NBRC 33097 / NRRL 1555) TaxID=763407 RepID=A0A167KXA3_PHYB8|nr:hypothetical protein PHYBLDRAFT_160052 [Phycomyces blakesleeanus NRRL 1555(-)]OAD69098.1 hypothetical protein PHYBLDRAFT_160052 [Phycomyces blakesleeanus NRRL 1555(-)]|eukprot:XP_018287138.1 hypothetical protein PHYBLDRAFT_160052 [Phycomyces blakesleeanus NRRL 1555(-)]